MVKCLTHGLRGFNVVQCCLATKTMSISSCWQLLSEVELRRIFYVCKRWANSGSHEFVNENMVRYMRLHGRFAHCSCKNGVRQPPVLGLLYRNILFLTSFCINVLLPKLSIMSWFRFSISPIQVNELTLYTLLRPTSYIVIPVLGLYPFRQLPRMGLKKEKLFASGCLK